MTNLSSQQIYDIAASLLKEEGFPEPKSVWVWQDVFSKDLIDKGLSKNKSQVTIYLKIEGREILSFIIEVSTEAEYRNKLKAAILNEIKFLV